MRRFAALLDGHRPLVAAFVVAMTLVAAFGLTRFRFDSSLGNLFRTDDGHVERLEEVYGQFGSDDAVCFVVVEATDALDPGVLEVVREVHAIGEGLPCETTVISLGAPEFAPLLAGPGERVRERRAGQSLVAGNMSLVREFGLLAFLAFSAALLGDLVFLPAMLAWHGRRETVGG